MNTTEAKPKTRAVSANGVVTAKIPNGVLITFENGFVELGTDDDPYLQENPFYRNYEVGDEVEWILLLDENENVYTAVTFDENLEKLLRIIEYAFGVQRLTVTDQSALCDFPAYEGALIKVSRAVGFEVTDTDSLFDIARRMAV